MEFERRIERKVEEHNRLIRHRDELQTQLQATGEELLRTQGELRLLQELIAEGDGDYELSPNGAPDDGVPQADPS